MAQRSFKCIDNRKSRAGSASSLAPIIRENFINAVITLNEKNVIEKSNSDLSQAFDMTSAGTKVFQHGKPYSSNIST